MPPTAGPDGLRHRNANDGLFGADFKPPVLLNHKHVQSMFTQVPWRRRRVLRIAAELLGLSQERLIDCGDGIRLQGFLSTGNSPERGLVVLLHGWEGSAHSSYVLSAGSALLAAGFSVFRLNLRDHGDTKSLNEGLFHSCRIDEVVAAIRRIRETTGPRRLSIVGQSLGGNFALRVAARAEEAGLALDRVIAICPVLKPHSTMRALDEGFFAYRKYFLKRWRRSLIQKAAAFPHIYQFGDLNRFDNLTDTTQFFVERYTEFDSLDQYLSGYAITGDALSELSVSSRIILAHDDPVIPVSDLEHVSRSSSLEVTLVSRGGHCGFVDRPFGPTWIDRAIVEDLVRSAQAADDS